MTKPTLQNTPFKLPQTGAPYVHDIMVYGTVISNYGSVVLQDVIWRQGPNYFI